MKRILPFFILIFLSSCGVKVPYTNDIKDEFNLSSVDKVKKVQFYTSATIIMERSKQSGNQGTADDGALVSNSNKEQDRVIIPINTKCVFDSYGPNGELIVRFETGVGKTLTFTVRQAQATNAKYFLVADWTNEKGGKLTYGNETYFASSSSGTTYLMVKRKNLQKTKRKDRVVKGMKV
ncbi:MAG: hypothetical protein RIT43_1396 [Bacteroidota bacterium]